MFDHVAFGVSDYEESKTFFLRSLESIGIAVVHEGPSGIELSSDGEASLCIRRNGERTTPLHLAFVAENRDQVDAFYHSAIRAGAKDNGAPGIRSEYSENYYAAFVIVPDGHNVEVVCHEEQV